MLSLLVPYLFPEPCLCFGPGFELELAHPPRILTQSQILQNQAERRSHSLHLHSRPWFQQGHRGLFGQRMQKYLQLVLLQQKNRHILDLQTYQLDPKIPSQHFRRFRYRYLTEHPRRVWTHQPQHRHRYPRCWLLILEHQLLVSLCYPQRLESCCHHWKE